MYGSLSRFVEDFRVILFSFRIRNYSEELPEFVDYICVPVFTTAYTETFCFSYIVESKARSSNASTTE